VFENLGEAYADRREEVAGILDDLRRASCGT